MMKTVIKFRYVIIAAVMTVLNWTGAFASAPWTVNPADFRYDMTLYLKLEFSYAPMDYALYDVGVFYGDECRGVAETLDLPDGSQCLYLRARSNKYDGEALTFKYRERVSGDVLPVEDMAVDFEADDLIGYPSAPFLIRIIRHYDVYFHASEGGSVDNDGGHFPEGAELSVYATPDNGYHFAGWSDGSDINPRSFTVSDDLSLTANFEPNVYHLIYILDNEVYSDEDVKYGSALVAKEAPVKEGYTFSGWEGLPETMPAEDVSVVGSFSINSYRLMIFLNDETYREDILEFGTPITIETPEVPEGYAFKGWQEEIPETMPAHDLEIHGSYELITGMLPICCGDDPRVTVSTIDGKLLFIAMDWAGVYPLLTPGIYIINGKRYVVKK